MMNHVTSDTVSPASPRFKGEVLSRIYRVWLFRKLLPVLLAEIAILAFILYRLGRAVFVQRIVENALKVFFANPAKIIPFFFSAFAHAPASTKLLIIVVLVACAFFIRHATQGLLRFILVRQNYFSRVGSREPRS